MTNHASTVHPFDDPTIERSSSGGESAGLEGLIAREWEGSTADLVEAIARHPEVLENRSVLLNLALLEYRDRQSQGGEVKLEDYCQRFRHLGRSVEQSIFRQLETQQYLDNHPELLDMLEIPKWPEPGESFGNFEIIEELGTGGIARVYLATQADLGNRTVVVKATPYSSYEASILGRLSHPNIVPIHFAAEVEEHNLSFLCMPYYGRSTLVDLIDLAFEDGLPRDGEVLSRAALRWLPRQEREAAVAKRSRSSSPSRASYVDAILWLALRMAEALQYSHERGIVHGDLKPSNVLLTPAGDPLLLDFNLSRDSSAPGGACGGTLSYMPPEQLRQIAAGSDGAEDEPPSGPTSDIYSFGALVYELLAGRPPVALGRLQDSPQVAATLLLKQLSYPHICLRQRNHYVPRGLESLVRDCLAIDPAERPQSMDEVRRRLQMEARWTAALRRCARRRPWLLTSTATVLLCGVASLGILVANQPAPHVALYNSGIKAQEAGDWEEAQAIYLRALSIEPDHTPAQLELGRAYLAQGQVDLALSTLEVISLEEPLDPQLLELVGYLYNLKALPTAAIAWYEKSLEHGGGSAAAFNNLAASYLSGEPKLAQWDRLERQELYLRKAIELDPESDMIRLNLVRHAVAKAATDLTYDPREVSAIVEGLRSRSGDGDLTYRTLASWERAVQSFDEMTTTGSSSPPFESLLEEGDAARGPNESEATSSFEGPGGVPLPRHTGFLLRPPLAP